MLRDIHQSEADIVMRSGNRDITIRKLSIEDSFFTEIGYG